MKKVWLNVALVAGLAVVSSGCGSKLAEPVAINAAVDKCDICSMTVNDDINATEIILKNGKALKFDDIGDMYVWTKKNGTTDVDVQYVRDYKSKEWVQLKDATFAYDPSFHTPMAYNMYSFKDSKEAEAFIAEQKTGKVLTVKDLDSHNWERNKENMHMGDMKGGHDMKNGDTNGGNHMDMNKKDDGKK